MFSARQRWRQAPRRKASARPRKRQKALHAWTRPVSWENGAINATDLQVHVHDANFSLEFVQQSRTKLSALGEYSMLRLYNFHVSSTSYRTRIVLNLKGLTYEYIPIRLDRAEHLGAAYREINPMRGLPPLQPACLRL